MESQCNSDKESSEFLNDCLERKEWIKARALLASTKQGKGIPVPGRLERDWFAEVLFLRRYPTAFSADESRVPRKFLEGVQVNLPLLGHVAEMLRMSDVWRFWRRI